MKSSLITCFLLLFSISNSIGQTRKVNFGLDVNPISVISGHYEGVIAINLTNKIIFKTAMGVAYAGKYQIKSRCAVADGVEDRVEKGWFGKLSIEYSFWNFKGIDCYLGTGLFYTDFKTSGTRGIRDPSGTGYSIKELKNKGDIFAGGISLGTKFKLFNRFNLDVGAQIYHHKGDKHQVGKTCHGTIPGIGAPDSSNLLGTIYVYLMVF